MDYEISSQQAHMRGSVWGAQPGFSLSVSLSLYIYGNYQHHFTNGKIECSEVLRADTFRVFVRATCVRRNESDRKLKQIWNDVIYYNDKMIKQEIFD